MQSHAALTSSLTISSETVTVTIVTVTVFRVRQEADKRPKAAGKKIKKIKKSKQMELFPDVEELGNYRSSCFITSLTLPAKAVYDLYRGRADSENRIKEIKYPNSG